MRTACTTVATPLTASAANTAQFRYASLPPAVLMRIAGVNTTVATASTVYWMPRPRVRAGGGRSSAS